MDEAEMERAAALRKKRTFRKFLFRGVELEKLLDLNHEGSSPSSSTARAPPHLPRAQGKAQALRSQIAPGEGLLEAHGQARAREDAPERHGRRARDDRQRRGRLQRQGFNGIEVKPEMVGRALGAPITYAPPCATGGPGIGDEYALLIPLK